MKDSILAAIAAFGTSGTSEASPATGSGTGIGIADWRLVETRISRQENYFVRSDMEQTRSVETASYSLTVYVDTEAEGKKFRGEATITIQPTHSPAEIKAAVASAAFAASKSKNPWYSLVEPSPAAISLPASGFETLGIAGGMETSRRALFSPVKGSASGANAAAGAGAGPGAGRLNSLELFVSRQERSFLNSQGQRFSTDTWRGYSEFVVDAESPSGIVELFDDIEFSEPDPVRLAEATGSRLSQVEDRARAIPFPALKNLPVILSGKEAEQVFEWFFHNAQTQAVYSKISPFRKGLNVQRISDEKPDVADPLDLWAEPWIEGLPASAAFDPDGYPLVRTPVILQGVLENLVGSIRHADWLGIPRKGNFPLFSVSPGSMSLQEMKNRPHLEPVMFSDFRLDTVTGDFGAEMRLAYWFDGEKRIPVTGGAISGSVAEFRATMRRSSELGLGAGSRCPRAILIEGLSF